MSLKYRPEIDGLRAIAVLSVVFYHAEILIFGNNYFGGGFIGVDIFFVISGYLISSILLKNLRDDKFSFLNFYERRARRILPALFVVLLACIPIAWLYLLPKAMKEFAGSGLSALFFSSNIWFFAEDSYTAEASALKPLLHTWTLSLEEQFYIIFPVILLVAWKFCRKYLLGILVVMFLISLQLANVGSLAFSDANFYLLPTRGWELLAGAILATLELRDGRKSPAFLSQILPAIGLFLILHAIVTFNDEMRHPSYMTLLPILGTMMVIWFAKKDELITDLLSAKMMVGVGLISYSLYLWHFPVFAFSRVIGFELTELTKWILIFISIVLGVFSYYLVEKTTRRATIVPRKPFYIGIVSGFVILTVAFGGLYYSNGAPSRLGPVANLYDDAKTPPITALGATCFRKHPLNYCEYKPENATNTVIAIGDSHSHVVSGALLNAAKANNANFIKLNGGGCPYIWNTYIRLNGKTKANCKPERSEQVRAYLAEQPPSVVVMTNNYPYYLSREHFDNREGGKIISNSDYALTLTDYAQKNNLKIEDLLVKSVRDILRMGHTVVLVYPIPETGWHIPEYVQKHLSKFKVSERLEQFQAMDLTTSYHVYRQRSASTKKIFDSLGTHETLVRIYPANVLCSESTQRCATHDDERLYYFDNNHVSPYGAKLIVDEITDALEWTRVKD